MAGPQDLAGVRAALRLELGQIRIDEVAQMHDAVGVPKDAVFHAADRMAADATYHPGLVGAVGKRDPVAELYQFRRQIAGRRL